jgi:protein gp37
MAATSIEWTDATWNPLTGCTKISPGCDHCYAERMARRLKAMGQPNYAAGFRLALHEHTLEIPLRWKRPQNVFVNSMSDLFHQGVPSEFIAKVFEVMIPAVDTPRGVSCLKVSGGRRRAKSLNCIMIAVSSASPSALPVAVGAEPRRRPPLGEGGRP